MVRGIFGSSLLACYPAACVIYGVAYYMESRLAICVVYVSRWDICFVRISVRPVAWVRPTTNSGSGMGASDHILKPAHPP